MKRWWYRINDVNITGKKRRNACAVIGNEAKHHALPRFGRSPMGRRTFKDDILPPIEAYPAIWASTNGSAATIEIIFGRIGTNGCCGNNHDGGKVMRQ
jgi:hypothetical protein